ERHGHRTSTGIANGNGEDSLEAAKKRPMALVVNQSSVGRYFFEAAETASMLNSLSPGFTSSVSSDLLPNFGGMGGPESSMPHSRRTLLGPTLTPSLSMRYLATYWPDSSVLPRDGRPTSGLK